MEVVCGHHENPTIVECILDLVKFTYKTATIQDCNIEQFLVPRKHRRTDSINSYIYSKPCIIGSQTNKIV